MNIKFRVMLACCVTAAFAAPIVSAENIKVAFIDGFSGPMAPITNNIMNSYQMFAELANKQKWAGDNTIEFVAFDIIFFN